MSKNDAIRFLQEIHQHPKVQRKLKGLKGKDAIRDLIALAQTIGYHFTEKEYRFAVVALSDGELEAPSLDNLIRDMGLNQQVRSGFREIHDQ
ncbi:MAG TPA: Nif11-like leader peptide family natural product precursor [Candidatus Hydrogenedentes bacterium]|nr:Nif11-like leader peptide family natural product precursor [Candidatus Hydrogenedentota bacterium]